MASLSNAGSITQGDICEVNTGTGIVFAQATADAASGANTSALLQLADSAGIVGGGPYTVVSNPPLAGEVRRVVSAQEATGFTNQSFTDGIQESAPIDQAEGVGVFWALGANNERTIAQTPDRRHTFYLSVATRPETWTADVIDSATCSVNFEFRMLTTADLAFPVPAELTVSSFSTPTIGVRRDIPIDFTSILVTRFPALMQIMIENRGDNSAVACFKQSPIFGGP